MANIITYQKDTLCVLKVAFYSLESFFFWVVRKILFDFKNLAFFLLGEGFITFICC